MANELEHSGVLGMKWGRRKDRSANNSADHNTSRIIKKKRVSEMSNDELKKLTTRLQLEKQLKDLQKGDITPGQKFVNDVLQGAGKQLASKYIASFAESGGKIVVDLLSKNKQG